MLLQLPASRHPQVDRGQSIGLMSTSLLRRELQLGRGRWRWLVREQAYAGQVVVVVANVFAARITAAVLACVSAIY